MAYEAPVRAGARAPQLYRNAMEPHEAALRADTCTPQLHGNAIEMVRAPVRAWWAEICTPQVYKSRIETLDLRITAWADTHTPQLTAWIAEQTSRYQGMGSFLSDHPKMHYKPRFTR
jgi:hypothetical protein